MVSLFSAYKQEVSYLELSTCIMPVLLIYSHTTKLTALDKRRQYSNNICLFIHQNIYHDILCVHTCHKLWTKICEIRQNFKGDLTKFCEIFLNITLEFPQYSLKCLFFFMQEACENHNNV